MSRSLSSLRPRPVALPLVPPRSVLCTPVLQRPRRRPRLHRCVHARFWEAVPLDDAALWWACCNCRSRRCVAPVQAQRKATQPKGATQKHTAGKGRF